MGLYFNSNNNSINNNNDNNNNNNNNNNNDLIVYVIMHYEAFISVNLKYMILIVLKHKFNQSVYSLAVQTTN